MSSGLLGWLGAVALLFGLLNLILQIFTGFSFAQLDLPWIWANFVVGLLLLGFALVSNLEALRERIRTGGARRAGKYGTSAILNAALGIALLGLLAFLSTRYHARWDWSESKSNTLTDQTLKLLGDLKEEVHATAFYQTVAAQPARDLLERYSYASPAHFKVSFVDPQSRPGLVKEMKVDESKLGNGVVVLELGGEKVQVDAPTEETVTNALVKLTRREKKKVYFLTGHGEHPASGDGANDDQGLQFAKQALENENYSVEALLLASKGAVPDDADVVIEAGPQRDLLPNEKDALQHYLERGGALLVLLEPNVPGNITEKLAEWGVDAGNDVIVDPEGVFSSAATTFGVEYAPHPITEKLREPTLFNMARSVQPKPDAAKAFTVLVRTGKLSWAERDVAGLFRDGKASYDEKDLRGPVPVAVAGQLDLSKAAADAPEGAEAKKSQQARLVVVGDVDFATNPLLGQFRNRDFFVNSVNWLLGDVEAISVRPNPTRASRLQLTPEVFTQLRYLSLFVLPEAIAVIGVFVWWRRRTPAR